MQGMKAFLLVGLLGLAFSASIKIHEPVQIDKLDLCKPCISFTDQAIDEVLNIIVNGGVVGGCSDLCGKLGNQVESTVCDLLCDLVGIDAFIDLIKKADLDPIYFCELLKVCPVTNGGNATIDHVGVEPTKGAIGTVFNIEMLFTVYNTTSTGEIAVNIKPPDGDPTGSTFVNEGYKPGRYGIRVEVKTDEQNKDGENVYQPGNYGVEVLLCEGTCGSGHPHSAILGSQTTGFTITE